MAKTEGLTTAGVARSKLKNSLEKDADRRCPSNRAAGGRQSREGATKKILNLNMDGDPQPAVNAYLIQFLIQKDWDPSKN